MPSLADEIIEKFGQVNQKLAQEFLKTLTSPGKSEAPTEILQSLGASLNYEAERWADIQSRYYQKHLDLWMGLLGRQAGKEASPVVEAEKGDRRFHAAEWKSVPYYDYLKQYYLLTGKWLLELVDTARLDPEAKRKLCFFTRQYVDAMSPSNFPTTNPEALNLAMETEGASVLRGLENLLADIEKGRISMTDESAFEVGRNIAVTPGAVIYENELFQLLQYSPTTETVYERPLLMVPPFINKYYILDLQPENSFVRFCLNQGITVFLVSWRNIPPELGATAWDDYIEKAVFKAMEVARDVAGVEKLNMLGFCVGGTLLCCALAVLAARESDQVESFTLLTSLLDFTDTGEISVYVDEAYVQKREKDFEHGGVLHGRDLAQTFASLRANELIWFYVVNNYLKGRNPEPFDLLYWNSDSANLPGRLYAYYARNMYLENNLRVPGKLTMCGVPVDLSKIRLPAFVLATKEDHIVPWRSAYASTRLVSGNVEFVLGASGHIAGVINPASKNRRNCWIRGNSGDNPEAWLASAESVPGSWWNHWKEWFREFGGSRVPARRPLGNDQYREIEPAPGRYVKVRF
ncbi:MAG: class I poly(R)-hydroxyalkanoic acid synthase [Betaproteobacteria bacterium]|nr:class I poly(R)-hydroxyalkanoic acid synthase [Betaproteobacteria bacterium]